ncbi:hypothetical protein IVB25_16580 [Bradyrhizobium sp. 193]|uniref:hypothetical protein n=1 Tax=unclassified Bradyrhizobium TaxID=2631580 RepID=UPI001FF9E386|nr:MULTISPECIES: hypothetical protein [unclassified Bradyrhizobium]MCK1345043.1 hypothetical protein [Bradyrhizobium sp. CW11]MCK1484283.1 hypothetical protein [Bradyrhizobium sp. 193]MCK1707511.1 hypothetical protein [Bradyrhizobium sp. 146]
MTNVVYLRRAPDRITTFLRVGVTGHRQLETLLMSGKLPAERLMFDASAFSRQGDLVTALKRAGRELSLDTNVAELSCLGRFQGAAKTAPWANSERVITERDLLGNEALILSKIARFAVANGLDRVQAPAHYLERGVKDPWFRVDLEACARLRRQLDMEGGKDIALDYPLMISAATLNDPAERAAIIPALAHLPIQSLWLRISRFGADATPAGVSKYISAVREFRGLDLPVVADGAGGMAGLAIVAFGAASGLAHGVAEKERFDATTWNKPRPEKKTNGGGGYTVLLPGIDRLLKKEEAQALIGAPHARRLLSCQDRNCCPAGFDDTLKDPKGHYLRQRSFHCDDLSTVQDPLKPKHFMDKTLAGASKTARQAAKLKTGDDKLGVALSKNAVRLERMGDVLDNLHKTEEDSTRVRAFAEVKPRESGSKVQDERQ